MSGALSWGLQAWDLLRWAWPSHRTHPDFGTLEPFTQFWQGLWESVWSLWVAHPASAERWIHEQPLGFGSASASVERKACCGRGVLWCAMWKFWWVWRGECPGALLDLSDALPKERWKGWFPTWVSLMYLLSKTCLWPPFLALVDCSQLIWLLRPLWASSVCPWADLTTQLQCPEQKKPLAFLLWASAGWQAKCYVYVRYTIRNVWYSMSSLRSQNSLNLVLAPTQHTWPCQTLSRNIILPQLGFLSHLPLSWLKGKEVPRRKWTAHVSLRKWDLLDTLMVLAGMQETWSMEIEVVWWSGSFAPSWQPCWSHLKPPSHGGKCLQLLGRADPFPKESQGCAFLTSTCCRIQPHPTQRGLFLCQKGFWVSHGFVLPTEGAQAPVFNIPDPLVWVQWSAHCCGCDRASSEVPVWQRMLPAVYQVSLEPKWERKNNIKKG